MSQPGNSTDPSTPCERYRLLWGEEHIPDLTSFLAERCPLRTGELAAVLRIDQAQRWSLQLRLTCEDYFQRFPYLEQDSDAAIDMIYAEFLLRKKFGPQPTMNEFLARFPRHATLLEPQLQLDRMADSMEGEVAAGSAGGSGSLQSTDPNQDEGSLGTTRLDGPNRDQAVGAAARPEDRFGHYRLLRELGRGGMGTVWEAESLMNGRRVAIKLVSRTVRRDDPAAARFLREAQLAASISHPRSAFVLEAGWHHEQPYLVMELMPGKTLRSLVAAGPIPVAEAIDHILDVLDGLTAAHARGILHRDVKPANCFVDAEGRVKIGDYGLAQALCVATASEHFAGTPAFASPEQLRTAPLDERSDQYSLGATLYFLLARRPPFVGGPTAVISQVAADPPPRLTGLVEGLPAGLDRVVLKSLEKSPDQRYVDLAQFRQALLPFSSRETFLANVGRRLAAFSLDDTMLMLVSFGLLVVLLVAAMMTRGGLVSGEVARDELSTQASITAILFSVLGATYFTVAEGWMGAGLGKRLLRLRVVGPDGGRPGLARAALRTFFIPLACGWTMLDPFFIPRPDWSDELLHGFDLQRLLFVPMLLSTLSYIPVLIILFPMMLKRSTLGLHDRASGTRVIQLIEPSSNPHFATSRLPLESPVSASYGPFQVVGRQLTVAGYTVYEGYDEVLRRRARIIVHRQSVAAVARRQMLPRPTRNRWLQGGSDWDAYELPDGAPMIRGETFGQLDWEVVRQMLLDLAEELAAARREQSLPESLQLNQLYRTSSNRLILCEVPLVVTGEVRTFQGPQRDWEFFRYVVKSNGMGNGWPMHAREFCSGVHDAKGSPAEIDSVVARLREMLHRPASFRWDDRLGLMSLAIGAQAWVIAFSIVLWGSLVIRWTSLDAIWRFVMFALPAATMPGLGALILGRGLLMRFLGITLQSTRGQPVNRLRFCCRNVLAWAPWSTSWILFGWSMVAISMLRSTDHVAENDFFGVIRSPGIPIIFLAAFLPLISLPLAGLFALWHPTRSLAERLTGTRLVYE